MELPIEQTTVILASTRRLDAFSGPSLRRRAAAGIEAGQPEIILDLSLVREIDPSGMAALVSLVRSARKQGSDVVVRGVSDDIRRLFEMTGLDRVVPAVPAVPTVQAA
jgi:anti-sigma B factor antagonist